MKGFGIRTDLIDISANRIDLAIFEISDFANAYKK